MTKAEQIREYIAANPGMTNGQIATAFNHDRNTVAGLTNYMAIRAAKPTLERREIGRTITNQPIYAYWPIVAKQEAAPKVKDSFVEKRASDKKKASTIEQLVDQLAAQLAQQVVHKVKVRLTRELEALIPTTPPDEPDLAPLLQRLSAPKTVEPEKVRLPRVGVVGLLPVQAGELSQEFSGALDLRFASPDHTSELKSLEGCDVIFIHTRHMSHAADQRLRIMGVELRRVTGGVSKLKDELTAYFVKG